MPKYDAFSRRALRTQIKSWVHRNRKPILIVVVGAVGLVVLETFLLLGVGERPPWKWYLLGVMHAAVVATLVGALASTFVAHDREAIFHLRGAWGEENTRDELKRAKRKRLIWGWVDSVTLGSGDIDHPVVTRAGGLVAIDSKWRNQLVGSDHEAMARSASKAKLRAGGVVRTLLKAERGGHRAAGHSLSVRPVVIVWGALMERVPEGATIDGVDFVGGRALITWLRGLGGEEVSRTAAKDVISRLEQFRASAWAAATDR